MINFLPLCGRHCERALEKLLMTYTGVAEHVKLDVFLGSDLLTFDGSMELHVGYKEASNPFSTGGGGLPMKPSPMIYINAYSDERGDDSDFVRETENGSAPRATAVFRRLCDNSQNGPRRYLLYLGFRLQRNRLAQNHAQQFTVQEQEQVFDKIIQQPQGSRVALYSANDVSLMSAPDDWRVRARADGQSLEFFKLFELSAQHDGFLQRRWSEPQVLGEQAKK